MALRTGSSRACLGSRSAQPFGEGSDPNGGQVADSEFVEAGGHGAVALEPVDAALHGVALLVGLRANAGGLPPDEPRRLR